MTGVGTYAELDALDAQARELEALIDELDPDDLPRPTRCDGWTVRELLAHVAGALHVSTSLCRDETSEAATADRDGWYARAREAGSSSAETIADRARQEAARRSDEDLLAWVREEIRGSLAAFAGDPSRVVGRKGLFIRAGELAAARCVEVGVHTMDLGHATLRGERLHPDTARIVTGILDALLGAAPPSRLGWDTKTYVLTATGRRRLEPNERFTLGELAHRFPVLS